MSKIQRHFRQAHEECQEDKFMRKELATVDKYIPKQNRRYLCYIGHDLHGHFDPNHVDFEVLCGTFRTEKAAIAYPFIVGVFMLLSLIFFITTQLYYFLPLVLINVPFVVMLFIAIRRNCHQKMIPFLIFAAFEKIIWLATILFLCIVVFNPHWPVYLVVKGMCESAVVDMQMAILLIVLIFSIDLFVMLYLDYNVLFHFVYLLHVNTACCQHTSDCPGKGDVDPFWHGKHTDHQNCNGKCPHQP
uniref:Uncharacterized protein n=1 Tax=Panagrolaimus sp. JU765 TaxID=591449 RepID=A0AC34R3R6_9BILA